jgi:hypothetical protein
VLYPFVGPRRIADRASPATAGVPVESPRDVLRWIEATGQGHDDEGGVVATFVIDEAGRLRIADRRSEHVACAGGGPVLSAGEIDFVVEGDSVRVAWVSNQSTGYCPEPESWPSVAAALARARLPAPDGFDPAYLFRRCPQCGATNLVKDRVFVCAICDADLPAAWNIRAEG